MGSTIVRSLAALAVLGLSAAARAEPIPEILPDPTTPTSYVAHPWDAFSQDTPPDRTGVIQGRAVTPSKGHVVVVYPKGQRGFFMVKRTHVDDMQGQRLSADDVRDGDEVKVDFDVVGNTAIARHVTVIAHAPPHP